jgi:hypothetical protein
MHEHYLSRREAAEYLTQRGLKFSPNTLMKVACTGGGPRYARWSNRAVYLQADLDSWAAGKLKIRTSTSEARQ